MGLAKGAFESITHHSRDWLAEEIRQDDDVISTFTQGKFSTV